jgi:hypothetical protein
MKKLYFVLVFCLLSGIQTLFAQNQSQTDSITKANKQLQMQNDSMKQVQQKSAAVQASSSTVQTKDSRPIIKRLSFDLSTSFWINPSNVYFEFSPTVMYHFPKTWAIGTGPAYIYRRDLVRDVNISGWGGKVFGKANVTPWLYAWTEYQGISNQYIIVNDQSGALSKDHEYVDSWFLSLGINIRIGKRHGINLQALYDVLYKESSSAYYSPWTYRIGFGF